MSKLTLRLIAALIVITAALTTASRNMAEAERQEEIRERIALLSTDQPEQEEAR